jgi:diaminopimelate epimerase
MDVRTWERGVGMTLACGTAACAAAVAAMRKKLTDRKVVVTVPGGPLTVEWRQDNHVWMTGPVATDFTGVIDPDTLAWHKTGMKGAA